MSYSDIDEAIDRLEMSIRWIEDNEYHQFPGWLNVVMDMKYTKALLESITIGELLKDE